MYPHLNTWFLGHMQVGPPNSISISSTIFGELAHATNTDTKAKLCEDMHSNNLYQALLAVLAMQAKTYKKPKL